MHPTASPEPVLTVRDLVVEIVTEDRTFPIVDGVSFDLVPGEVLSLVGESGSGKSVTMLSLMGLLAGPGVRTASGEVRLRGRSLLGLGDAALQDVRGRDLAMIFQEPMTSLNPVLTVGRQIGETIRIHQPGLTGTQVRAKVVDLLSIVGVPDPERRTRQYPHEFSGGMRQRVMIAIAIANDPAVLIADEPTTALDVTIQAQVMRVLADARRRTGAAMILVTHDLGLVAETADRIAVMYGGRLVETGTTRNVFATPRHPYTISLLRSLPRLDETLEELYAIPGQAPSVRNRPGGCVFHTRCEMRAGRAICADDVPPLVPVEEDHASACHFAHEAPGWAAGISARQSRDVAA